MHGGINNGWHLAGVWIGPLDSLIDEVHNSEAMGEIGVSVLISSTGLELGEDIIRRLGVLLFGGDAIPVGITVALAAILGAFP